MSDPQRASQDREAAAAEWVAREMRGALRPHERRELGLWLAGGAGRADALARARAAYRTAGEMASHPDILVMRSAALASLRPQRRLWALASAAAVLLVVAVSAVGLLGSDEPASVRTLANDDRSASFSETDREHYATRIGERLSVTLEDGTTISLNTDSEAQVAYSGAVRRVHLLRGEALFDVARHADWPFEVVAGDQSVRALGTVFSVRRRDDEIEVVLVEGRVAVRKLADMDAALASGTAPRAIELEVGERLFASDGAVQIAAVDTQAATSWRQGRLVFDETPLRVAIEEVNRYRTKPLRIEDPRVAALRLSGGYRTADAMSFEQALAVALNVYPRASDDDVLLELRSDDAQPR